MNNYDTMLAGLKDLVDNPTPRVPVVLCLDISGSMSGTPIQELNAGVEQYLKEMCSDELTRYSVETALVTFSTDAQCAVDFEMPDRIQTPQLEADGLTCMGEGVDLALNLLEQRKAAYKATGVDYYQRRLTVVAVGIGPAADLDTLAVFTPKQKPVRLSGLQFREFFAWLSQSVASVSASLPGDEADLDREALEALEAEPWPENAL